MTSCQGAFHVEAHAQARATVELQIRWGGYPDRRRESLAFSASIIAARSKKQDALCARSISYGFEPQPGTR